MRELKKYPFKGGWFTIPQLTEILHKNKSTIRSAYKRGWDGTPHVGWDGETWQYRSYEEPCYDPYTEDELYEIFCYFAGEVSAEEELQRLSDFMALSLYKKDEAKLVEETLYRLRRRYISSGGREHP